METTNWGDKSKIIDCNQKDMDAIADGYYHPLDRVEILEDLVTYATKKAAECRETNEREGVPDRG